MAQEPFGFVVRANRNGSWEARPGELNGTWSVQLPHMCNEWSVAYRTDYEQAVCNLEAFITEAQQALAALKARQDFGEEI